MKTEQDIIDASEKYCRQNFGYRYEGFIAGAKWYNKVLSDQQAEPRTAPKSDAVEFAEWIIEKLNRYDIKHWDDDADWVLFKTAHSKRLTSEELYKEFLTQKVNEKTINKLVRP